MLLEKAAVPAAPHRDQGTPAWSFNGVSRGLLTLLDLHQRATTFARQAEEKGATDRIPLSILREILSALHFRDENTFHHSRRVGLIAIGIAQQLCWNKETTKDLEFAALLHDIGKIGIPDHLLYKPGRFNPEEYAQMGLSVEVAEDILQVCRVPLEIRRTVLEARRYYSGLEDYSRPVGTELSQGARVLAVADAYESLSREQVFRDAKDHRDIIAFLRERSGTQYDPRVVETLDRWLMNGGLSVLQASSVKDSNSFQSAQNGSLMIGAISSVFAELFAIEQAYDGLVLVDAHGHIVLANRGCLELFNQSRQIFQNQLWTPELFPISNFNQEPFAPGEYPLQTILRNRRPLSMNIRIPGPNRHWEAAEVQCLPLYNVDGVFMGAAEFYQCRDRSRQQSHQFRELALQASRDSLTGIANRGELENQLSNLMNKYLEDPQGSLFSVIYLDIDHFKPINDRYGHAVGDEVLVDLAGLLKREAFPTELVARYGGEEFVVLCPELELMQAAGRAERFRLEIAKLQFKGAPDLKITSSFGVAQIEAHDSLENVLKRADKALYQSKESGRNRTTVLKREELARDLKLAKPDSEPEHLQFRAEISGMLYDDLLVMKLKSFVSENQARILKVKKGYVKIQLGRKGLFSRWGKQEERQPVAIEVQAPSDGRVQLLGNKHRLEILIRPIGLPSSNEVFQRRARQAYRSIRSHFMTE